MIGIFGFLLWLGFCAAVATAANTRGRSALQWFLAAFFFTPLLAVCFLLALPIVDREQEEQKRIASAAELEAWREKKRAERRAFRAAMWRLVAPYLKRLWDRVAANWAPVAAQLKRLGLKLWAITPREAFAVGLLVLWGKVFASMYTAMQGHTTAMDFDRAGFVFTLTYILSFLIAAACLAFLLISLIIRVARLFRPAKARIADTMRSFAVWTCASLCLFGAFVIVTAINQPPPEPGTLAWAKQQTRKAEAAAKQQARELAALKALNDRQNAEGEARYQQQAKEVAREAEAARAKNFGTTPEVLGALREEFGRAGVSNEGFNALVDNLSRQVKEDYPEMMENIRTDAARREAAERRLREAEENLRRAYSQ